MAFKLLKCPVINAFCSLHRVDGSCAYPGGRCKEIIAECEGCKFIVDRYCRIYPNPSARWQTRRGCPRKFRLSELEKQRYVKNKTQKTGKDKASQSETERQQKEKERKRIEREIKTTDMGRIRRLIKKLLIF
jgi:hypothetical protein